MDGKYLQAKEMRPLFARLNAGTCLARFALFLQLYLLPFYITLRLCFNLYAQGTWKLLGARGATSYRNSKGHNIFFLKEEVKIKGNLPNSETNTSKSMQTRQSISNKY